MPSKSPPAKRLPQKRLPLPKRFNVAMTDAAYAKLRGLNERYGYGNNYLLTFILEGFDEIVVPAKLDALMQERFDEFGRPEGAMKKR